MNNLVGSVRSADRTPQRGVPAMRSLLLVRPDCLAASKRLEDFQIWRENDEICICTYLETAFCFEADGLRRILRRHCDHLM